MVIIKYVSTAGIMVVYIIGVGASLSSLFGGSALSWSLIFFIIGSFLIYNGLQLIKTVDFFLSLAILTVILIIAGFGFGYVDILNWQYINFSQIFFPYGIILFSFNAGSAVIESHSVLAKDKRTFKLSIIFAGLICMAAYAIFSVIVLGATGIQTTEIATIGLGQKIGPIMLWLGNIFAILAMGTCFLSAGLSWKDSLAWDYKLKKQLSFWPVVLIPLTIFLLGLRQFISTINLIGGVFVSLEMLLTIIIYWQAKRRGDLEPGRYKIHHAWLLVALLLIALIFGAIYSIFNMF